MRLEARHSEANSRANRGLQRHELSSLFNYIEKDGEICFMRLNLESTFLETNNERTSERNGGFSVKGARAKKNVGER